MVHPRLIKNVALNSHLKNTMFSPSLHLKQVIYTLIKIVEALDPSYGVRAPTLSIVRLLGNLLNVSGKQAVFLPSLPLSSFELCCVCLVLVSGFLPSAR